MVDVCELLHYSFDYYRGLVWYVTFWGAISVYFRGMIVHNLYGHFSGPEFFKNSEKLFWAWEMSVQMCTIIPRKYANIAPQKVTYHTNPL